jgi:competence protein ComEC
MVLTHAHPDHMNGLASVARNFRIKELWETFSPAKNATYDQLQRSLDPSTARRRMFRGQSRNIDGVTLEILHPPRMEPQIQPPDNDKSMVIRLVYGRTSFLFTADIGAGAERDILSSGHKIRGDVFKSPHHGSDSSSTAEFLAHVAPRFIVICVGEGNRYGLPDRVVLDRYSLSGAEVFRTDIHGAVEFSSDGEALSVRTAADYRK